MAEEPQQGEPQGEQPQGQSSEQGAETPPSGAEWAQGQEQAQQEGAESSQQSETGGGATEQEATGGAEGQVSQSQGGGLKPSEQNEPQTESPVAPLEGGEPPGATFAREQADRFEHPGQAEREAREQEEQQG